MHADLYLYDLLTICANVGYSQLAKNFEESIFNLSTNLSDYSDLLTLPQRLRSEVLRVKRNGNVNPGDEVCC
jgi:hypothetical protein